MDRRNFMKTIGAAGTAVLLNPMDVLLRRAMASPRYFGLHPFIEAHPEAVFIKRTHVSIKTDAEAKKEEGVALAREIFVPKDTPGFPFSHRIVVKPNLTEGGRGDVESMGIITDPYFVEGVIEGMKESGLRGDQFSLIEINGPQQWSVKGYTQMAQRTGVHLRDLTRDVKTLEEGTEVTWVDCPDGVMFKRIAYLAPVNQPDTWLLNIPKFKAHGMGLTLCCKNQQGMCAQTYVNFCGNVNRVQGYPSHVFADFQPDFVEHLDQLYAQHVEAGIPRWDRPGGHGGTGGFWMETWAQRTCDSLSVTDTGFCIVEGVYGRDGNGFMNGPGPGGTAQDYMTNVLIFGKDKFRVDMIGHWLGGHEPGNFGLFHIARERGLSNVLNPAEIPVYRWEDGVPALTPLTDFERFPLKTYYLQRDYAGQNEPKYHLVDEPFDYGPFTSVAATDEAKPGAYVLGQNFPNPFNASTVIEYQMPRDGYVSLEVYNAKGQRIEVLVDGWRMRGAHMASWNARKRASGAYFYRFRTDGFEESRKMVLVQ